LRITVAQRQQNATLPIAWSRPVTPVTPVTWGGAVGAATLGAVYGTRVDGGVTGAVQAVLLIAAPLALPAPLVVTRCPSSHSSGGDEAPAAHSESYALAPVPAAWRPPLPKLDLTFSAGALSDDAKQELPAQLAEAMLRWEGAPNTQFFRSISWTHVHELADGAAHTADGAATDSQFVVEVTVPQGALSERRRGGLVDEFTKLVAAAAGLGDDETFRVWVIVNEVTEGHWGAAGQIVHFEQLREAAKAEREKAEAPA
jgi:phenylpyruvate tautomerase PptA (4-oxalocrotonate tautomerase family)